MTRVTLDISDELAARLRGRERDLDRIIASGLRHMQPGESASEAVLEAISSLLAARTPDEVLALRPDAALAARAATLVEKSHDAGLTADEQAEWQRYELLEHFIRLAKARAALQRQSNS
ncbi:MAG: hypothetical protein WD768_17010 [Phycisphaeraceae bacterium]